MKIWVNCLVQNEENFIWFAVKSVIDYVDKILIWDSGSDDRTVEIIKILKREYPKKIEFNEVGKLRGLDYTKVRQQMLEESDCDYLVILDGDEIWFEDSINKLIKLISSEGDQFDGIVVPFYQLIGDIYHHQEERAGKYNLVGKKGHLTLRAISRKIPGLHFDKPYPHEGFFNGDKKLVQEVQNLKFLDAPFMHVSHLKRSPKKRVDNKFKYEMGRKFPENFKYPEVFFERYPEFISSPFRRMNSFEFIASNLFTPLRRLKRVVYDKLN